MFTHTNLVSSLAWGKHNSNLENEENNLYLLSSSFDSTIMLWQKNLSDGIFKLFNFKKKNYYI